MITALPSPPSTNDPANFEAKADALLAALPLFVTETNATAVAMNLNSTTDTSASSVAIGAGAKSFTVSTGKSFQPGMYLVIADTAAPSTNSMFGQIASYDVATGALVVNIVAIKGSGIKSSWVVSQSSAGGAAPSDIQTQAYTAFATAGTTTAYTLTPSPAITSLVAGHRFRVKFNAANTSTTPTLAVNGLAATALKVYDATGSKVNPSVGSFTADMLTDVEYDGTDCVVMLPRRLATTAEVQTGADVTLSPSVATMRNGLIVLGTPVAATSGTALEFTSIPSWAKKITLSLVNVSTNGVQPLYIHIGDAGGFEITGYVGSTVEVIGGGGATFSNGFRIGQTSNTVAIYQGSLVLTLESPASNRWSIQGVISRSDAIQNYTLAGHKSLSAVLDRIRLATDGIDAFDGAAGAEINIAWE